MRADRFRLWQVLARYEGLTCNTTGWHQLRPDELRRSAAATITARGSGKWRWQSKHEFVFNKDGTLVTPWHRGIWGLVPDRGEAEYVFARFAQIDHLLKVGGEQRIDSVRCEDGDAVAVVRA